MTDRMCMCPDTMEWIPIQGYHTDIRIGWRKAVMEEDMMGDRRFRILEGVCASTNDKHHFLILKAKDHKKGNIIWAIGDDQVCAVAGGDFIRDRSINYKDVCIQEFPYRDNTPESVGEWRPLIQELVRRTLRKYLEHNGAAGVYPQWLPEEVRPNMEQDMFQEWSKDIDHIILHDNNVMEMVPRSDTPAMDSPSL